MLVLLPTLANKLHAKWQGPYVVKKVGSVDYQVDMPDKKKRMKVLHVNMLRTWHTPAAVSYLVDEVEEGERVGSVQHYPFDLVREKAWREANINSGLGEGERSELDCLLAGFRDILQDSLGGQGSLSTGLILGMRGQSVRGLIDFPSPSLRW